MHWPMPRVMVLLVVASAGCGGSPLGPGKQDAATADTATSLPEASPAADAFPVAAGPDAQFVCPIRLGLQRPSDPVGPPDPLRGNPRNLTPVQLATRLARFLWASAPEPSLVEKIAACPPYGPEQVQDLARQMLADPRARQGVQAFFTSWLTLEEIKQYQFTPGIPPALVDAIGAEPARFGAHVVFDGDSKLETLLTSSYSVLNATLAAHYGVTGVSGADFVRVTLDPAQRRGLLSQAGILVQGGNGSDTNPTRRGRFIRERILCQVMPDPPPTVNPRPQQPGQTKREWLAAEPAQPPCAPCHTLMDPLGLAFEHYDSMGRYRADDNGRAIDTSGSLPSGLEPALGMFTGPLDLITLLVKSDLPAACFATKLLEHASGRPLEDESARRELVRRFAQNAGDMKWLLAFVTTTKMFLTP